MQNRSQRKGKKKKKKSQITTVYQPEETECGRVKTKKNSGRQLKLWFFADQTAGTRTFNAVARTGAEGNLKKGGEGSGRKKGRGKKPGEFERSGK